MEEKPSGEGACSIDGLFDGLLDGLLRLLLLDAVSTDDNDTLSLFILCRYMLIYVDINDVI